jgi:hypothetical protein
VALKSARLPLGGSASQGRHTTASPQDLAARAVDRIKGERPGTWSPTANVLLGCGPFSIKFATVSHGALPRSRRREQCSKSVATAVRYGRRRHSGSTPKITASCGPRRVHPNAVLRSRGLCEFSGQFKSHFFQRTSGSSGLSPPNEPLPLFFATQDSRSKPTQGNIQLGRGNRKRCIAG